jgi:hypothetical protein
VTGQEAEIREALVLLVNIIEGRSGAPTLVAPHGQSSRDARAALDALDALVAERDQWKYEASGEYNQLIQREYDRIVAERDWWEKAANANDARAEQAVAERDRLREALTVYADARHWAIRRNETRYPDCIWIGPGAEETVPNAPETARAALAVSTP